jgi:hypothetical protein
MDNAMDADKEPENICLWSTIAPKSHPFRISNLRMAEEKGFWATRQSHARWFSIADFRDSPYSVE